MSIILSSLQKIIKRKLFDIKICKQIVLSYFNCIKKPENLIFLTDYYQSFFSKFINFDQIPNDDKTKGECYLILSFMLEPLSTFFPDSRYDLDPLDVDTELSIHAANKVQVSLSLWDNFCLKSCNFPGIITAGCRRSEIRRIWQFDNERSDFNCWKVSSISRSQKTNFAFNFRQNTWTKRKF